MLGQNLLLLVPLLLLSQICVFVLWMIFIQGPRIDEAASLVASQIIQTERLFSYLSPSDRRSELAQMNGSTLTDRPPLDAHEDLPSQYALRRFYRHLRSELPQDVQLRWQTAPVHRLWVRLRPQDNFWIVLPVKPVDERFSMLGILFMLFTIAAFPTLGAFWLHRRIERPLKRLARAAVKVESGQWPPAVPVSGPTEVVMVIDAFNRMTATLADSETTRAEMLAGISHDIRTPLTKLRMVIASPEAFETPAVIAERFVEDIDAIVGQFIDLARGTNEELQLGDLNVLVEQLACDYVGLGQSFALDLSPLPLIEYRPISMQRMLLNLMQNAAVYGRTGLLIGTRVADNNVILRVDDAGPGIAEELMDVVRQPFRRGTRVNEKGGTGLGLAIADRIARQHGGTLKLQRSPAGGLTVEVGLPIG